jgi:hypothetical protein
MVTELNIRGSNLAALRSVRLVREADLSDYKFYCIDDAGHIFKRHDYHAPDDFGALEQAQQLCGPHEIEVWEGARFVTRVNKKGKASLIPTKGPHSD